LIVLVASSLALAYERRDKWLLAGISVVAGLVACGVFVAGLWWL
jgi:hypothetical protein